MIKKSLHRVRDVAAEIVDGDSMQVVCWIAAGGIAIAIANLIFAGILSQEDFGRLVLIQGLLSVGVGVGPVGFDNLAIRHELPRTEASLWLGAGISFVSGLLIAGGSTATYDLDSASFLILFFGCFGGALGILCSGFERGLMRLDRAQLIQQIPFIVFLLIAAVLLPFSHVGWVIAATGLAAGYVASALVGIYLYNTGSSTPVYGERRSNPYVDVGRRKRWSLAFAFVLIAGSGFILGQLERLIIPLTLSYAELAVFGVAWTIVGSPYKLLQGGIGYALLPKLRLSRHDEVSGKRLIRKDLLMAAVVGGGGGVVLFLFAPWVVDFLYGDKYSLGWTLVAVLVLMGLVRLAFQVSSATIKALGDRRQLYLYGVTSWIALALGGAAAIGFARWGLEGVIIGAIIAWSLRTAFIVGILRFAPR